MQVQHLVRASDPLSSVLAAEGAMAFAGGHCERILAALANGRQATPHELQEDTGLTVVQIDRRLCEAITPRKTYAEEAGLPRLPAPEPAAPMKVSFEMRGDGKDWARRIMARQEAGDRIRPYSLQCARQALGMDGKMPWQ